jgi:hypothetical protein
VASEFIEFEVGLLCDEPQDLFGVRTHGCTRRSGLFLNGLDDAGSRLIGAQSLALRLGE